MRGGEFRSKTLEICQNFLKSDYHLGLWARFYSVPAQTGVVINEFEGRREIEGVNPTLCRNFTGDHGRTLAEEVVSGGRFRWLPVGNEVGGDPHNHHTAPAKRGFCRPAMAILSR